MFLSNDKKIWKKGIWNNGERIKWIDEEINQDIEDLDNDKTNI